MSFEAPATSTAMEDLQTRVTLLNEDVRTLQAGTSGPTATGDVRALEADVRRLRAEMGADRVTVGLRVFPLRLAVQDFVVACNASGCGHLFLDAVSALELMVSSGSNREELITYELQAQRTRYSSEMAATYAQSFKLELPIIFGKVETGSSSKMLPALDTYEKWNSGRGIKDLMTRINDEVDRLAVNCGSRIEEVFGEPSMGEPMMIAQQLLRDSVTFVKNLSAFIMTFYSVLSTSSSAAPKECWELVSMSYASCFRRFRRRGNSPRIMPVTRRI